MKIMGKVMIGSVALYWKTFSGGSADISMSRLKLPNLFVY